MTDDFMTPAEVAHQLKVSAATLADWRYKRQGPEFVKVGRLVRYRSEAIGAWVAQQTAKTGVR